MKNEEKNNSTKLVKDSIIGSTFLNKYYCTKKIGEGSFGYIYEANYNGKSYAIKIEDKKEGQDLLVKEALLLKRLKGPNIPEIISYGNTSSYNILVMQLLGKSLSSLLLEKRIFSLKTVCMLGYQMISTIEHIHERDILHRDIKPDNFVMGLNELSDKVYLIDFGLSMKYRSSKTLVQYPLINKNGLIGTARFASINALKGYEQSRRDDLESLGYVFIYLLKGKLPWQGLRARAKFEQYKKILEKKIEISSHELCEDLPEEFERYLEYSKTLEYTAKPDYNMLKNLFLTLLIEGDYEYDFIYDWTSFDDIRRRKEPKMIGGNRLKNLCSISISSRSSSHVTTLNKKRLNKIDKNYNTNSKTTSIYSRYITSSTFYYGNDLTKNRIRNRNKILFTDKKRNQTEETKNINENDIEQLKINIIKGKEEALCCSTGCFVF